MSMTTADELMTCINELGELHDRHGRPLTKIIEWIKIRDGITATRTEIEKLRAASSEAYQQLADCHLSECQPEGEPCLVCEVQGTLYEALKSGAE